MHDVIIGQNESFVGAGNGRDDDSRAELVRNEVGRIGLIRIAASLGLDVEGIELADVGAGPDAGNADHRGLDPVNHVDEDSLQRPRLRPNPRRRPRERPIVPRGSTNRPPARPEGLRRDGKGGSRRVPSSRNGSGRSQNTQASPIARAPTTRDVSSAAFAGSVAGLSLGRLAVRFVARVARPGPGVRGPSA